MSFQANVVIVEARHHGNVRCPRRDPTTPNPASNVGDQSVRWSSDNFGPGYARLSHPDFPFDQLPGA
jgi:hypothetical protein